MISATKKLLTLKVNLDCTTFDYDFRRFLKTCFKIARLSLPETIGHLRVALNLIMKARLGAKLFI